MDIQGVFTAESTPLSTLELTPREWPNSVGVATLK